MDQKNYSEVHAIVKEALETAEYNKLTANGAAHIVLKILQRQGYEIIKPCNKLPKVFADKNGWVRCCYCGRLHRHGSGVGPNEASGFRFPDCAPGIEYEVMPYSQHKIELNLPYE